MPYWELHEERAYEQWLDWKEEMEKADADADEWEASNCHCDGGSLCDWHAEYKEKEALYLKWKPQHDYVSSKLQWLDMNKTHWERGVHLAALRKYVAEPANAGLLEAYPDLQDRLWAYTDQRRVIADLMAFTNSVHQSWAAEWAVRGLFEHVCATADVIRDLLPIVEVLKAKVAEVRTNPVLGHRLRDLIDAVEKAME